MTSQDVLQSLDESIVTEVFKEFAGGLIAAIPKVLSGIVFLVLAYVVIRIVLFVTRAVFEGIYPAEQDLIVDLSVTIVGLFLWFGAALALLKIVGLGDVAASLGTAAGFIGLGVAFAIKETIADTAAGVYLLQDPDFNRGDVVDTAAVTGTITKIDLRKTRIQTDDGDLVVLANREVEEKWTNRSVAENAGRPGRPGD